MTKARNLFLLLGLLQLFVLEITCVTYKPTFQLCGTPEQLINVTTWPYNISTNRNEMVKTFVNWKEPGFASRISLRVLKNEEAWLNHFVPNILETEGNKTEPIIATHTLSNATWEVSGIKSAECEALYQRTTLQNGAVFELIWEVFKDDFVFQSGAFDFTARAGVPKLRMYLQNYPYAQPGISTPSIEVIFGLAYSVPPAYQYANWYGEQDASSGFPPDPNEPNVTLAPGVGDSLTTQAGMTSKQRGYNISQVNNNYQFINYGVLNDDIYTKLYVRGLTYTVGADTRPNAFQTYFTFYANFTGVNDTLYYDSRLPTEATVTPYESTGSSSGAVVNSTFMAIVFYVLSVLF